MLEGCDGKPYVQYGNYNNGMIMFLIFFICFYNFIKHAAESITASNLHFDIDITIKSYIRFISFHYYQHPECLLRAA